MRILFFDQAHVRGKWTTEKMERTLSLRIERHKEMGRAIVRVKTKVFQPVTKLFYSDKEGTYE